MIAPDVGSISPVSSRSSVVLPLPLGPTSPTRIPAVRWKFEMVEKRLVLDRIAEIFELDEPLGLAAGEREVDPSARRAAASC